MRITFDGVLNQHEVPIRERNRFSHVHYLLKFLKYLVFGGMGKKKLNPSRDDKDKQLDQPKKMAKVETAGGKLCFKALDPIEEEVPRTHFQEPATPRRREYAITEVMVFCGPGAESTRKTLRGRKRSTALSRSGWQMPSTECTFPPSAR
jgi:hypothetical protein